MTAWNSKKSGLVASPRKRILAGQACGHPTTTPCTNATLVQPSAPHIAHTEGTLVEQATIAPSSVDARMPSCGAPVVSATWTRMVAIATDPAGGRTMPAPPIAMATSPPIAAQLVTAGCFETQPLGPTGTNRSLP